MAQEDASFSRGVPIENILFSSIDILYILWWNISSFTICCIGCSLHAVIIKEECSMKKRTFSSIPCLTQNAVTGLESVMARKGDRKDG